MLMSTTLVIVESPAKAKTIEKYLGAGYTVRASVGHVRDLPKSNTDAVDIEGGFIPKYIQSAGKEKVIEELRKEALKADHILLATDPDREGEAIAWHVAELIHSAKKEIPFNVKHQAAPITASIIPAIAGPMTRALLNIIEFKAMAFGRSFFPTISGTNA